MKPTKDVVIRLNHIGLGHEVVFGDSVESTTKTFHLVSLTVRDSDICPALAIPQHFSAIG